MLAAAPSVTIICGIICGTESAHKSVFGYSRRFIRRRCRCRQKHIVNAIPTSMRTTPPPAEAPAMMAVCECPLLVPCVGVEGEVPTPLELLAVVASPGQVTSVDPAVLIRFVLVPHWPVASLTETVGYGRKNMIIISSVKRMKEAKSRTSPRNLPFGSARLIYVKWSSSAPMVTLVTTDEVSAWIVIVYGFVPPVTCRPSG